MKKIVILSTLLLFVLTLSACEPEVTVEYDYIDFQEHLITTFEEAEQREDERYLVYYYGKSCGHCADIKQELLSFFAEFDILPFYILEISQTSDRTTLEEFVGTPTMFLMADGEVLDMYIGTTGIKNFIKEYESIETIDLQYSHFETQHLDTYDEALNIESDAYIIYYYLNDCPHCIKAKNDVLEWAFQRDIRDVYFMNGAIVSGSGELPTELIILNSGTPILLVMTNGKFADEYYSGTDPVLEYIGLLGMGEITTDNYVE